MQNDSRNSGAIDIPYAIRHSTRCKSLKINICRQKGVEVVLPRRMAHRHAEDFIRKNQPWILRHIKKLGLDQPLVLPDEITLDALDKTWQVQYRLTRGSYYTLRDNGNTLILSCPGDSTQFPVPATSLNNDHYPSIRGKLNQWLRQQARQTLPQWLDDMSTHCNLPYKKPGIRSQRTRWGSCSIHGNISLNDRLMFLSPALVEYVMIHELCHTRHLDHSADFWDLVASYCPDFKLFNSALKDAYQKLPRWL